MLPIYLTMLETEEEKEKLTQLYTRYEGLIYHIAYSFFKNQQDAEDAVHDAFLKLVKYLDKIEDISSHKTKAFVVIVIESICKDSLKKKSKHKTISFEQTEYDIAPQADIVDSIIEHCAVEQLRKTLMELETIHGQVLILRYSKQLPYDEIARILGVSTAAARKRVQRAKMILAQKLNEHSEIER